MPSFAARSVEAAAPPVDEMIGSPFTEQEGAILLAVLYADLFDYPLTEAELYRRLIHEASDEAFAHALAALLGPCLSRTPDGYITWAGREAIVDIRRRRSRLSAGLWASAVRYAGWLARVPFVRMVAVSGSLAVANAEDTSDIDVFCITEPKRLWIARLFIVPLSRLTRKFPAVFPCYFCPNYILALDALEVEDRNLFTAHEIAQAIPLWGGGAYHRFLGANEWIYGFLPHSRFEDRLHRLAERPASRFARWAERLFRGRRGDVLNGWIHGTFRGFYAWRARRRGWDWDRIGQAYQANRYTVPEGGYVRVIHRHFVRRVRERLGLRLPEAALERLFARPDEAPACYDWEGLFEQEYGAHSSSARA